jgi:hypothetical protein
MSLRHNTKLSNQSMNTTIMTTTLLYRHFSTNPRTKHLLKMPMSTLLSIGNVKVLRMKKSSRNQGSVFQFEIVVRLRCKDISNAIHILCLLMTSLGLSVSDTTVIINDYSRVTILCMIRYNCKL